MNIPCNFVHLLAQNNKKSKFSVKVTLCKRNKERNFTKFNTLKELLT